jgi:hypothetical protein
MVMDSTAATLDLTKAQLLNPESDNLATRVTLRQSQMHRETVISPSTFADDSTEMVSQFYLSAHYVFKKCTARPCTFNERPRMRRSKRFGCQRKLMDLIVTDLPFLTSVQNM